MRHLPEPDTRQYELLMNDVWELAEPRYIDLDYHNFAHAVNTAKVGRELVIRCLDNGIYVPMFEVDAAGIFHDADYHKVLPLSIRSKELRSSRIAGKALRRMGVPEVNIRGVQANIRPTEAGIPCRTKGAVITRRADLSNTTSGYLNFLSATYRLYTEGKQLNGSFPALPGFLIGSVSVLTTLYSEDLSLGPFDDMTDLENALTNIAKLGQETPISFLNKALLYARDRVVS